MPSREEFSVPTTHDLACPHCGVTNTVEVRFHYTWREDFFALHDFLNGRANVFACKACGHLGWAPQRVTIALAAGELVYAELQAPGASPEELTFYWGILFRAPAGEPFHHLLQFLEGYQAWWAAVGEKSAASGPPAKYPLLKDLDGSHA